MKESKKRLISLIGTTSIVALVAIGLTYSWMNHFRHSEVDNINVEVVRANELAISYIGGGGSYDFKHRLTANSDNYTFSQVSGDGAEFYSYVAALDENNAYYISGYGKVASDKYDEFLLRKEVAIKASFPVKLYLDFTSTVTPANKLNRISNGFSKDYVAGAMRVGLAKVEENGTISPQFIWAPNSLYQFRDSPVSFYEEGTVETSYKIIRGTDETNAITIPTFGNAYGAVPVTDGTYTIPLFMWGSPTENLFITNLDAGITKFIFSVWLEGTDRECNDYLAGGHIKADIKFTSESLYEQDE